MHMSIAQEGMCICTEILFRTEQRAERRAEQSLLFAGLRCTSDTKRRIAYHSKEPHGDGPPNTAVKGAGTPATGPSLQPQSSSSIRRDPLPVNADVCPLVNPVLEVRKRCAVLHALLGSVARCCTLFWLGRPGITTALV